MPRIQQLKAEPPVWGYPRIWASLRCVAQVPVPKPRGLRLLLEHHRLVQPHLRLQAKRTPTRSQPRPTKPPEGWGLDRPPVMVTGFGGLSRLVGLDWYRQTIVGD
jgi:hypothetical protein